MLGSGEMDDWVHGKIPVDRDVYNVIIKMGNFLLKAISHYSIPAEDGLFDIPLFHVDGIFQIPLKTI